MESRVRFNPAWLWIVQLDRGNDVVSATLHLNEGVSIF